MEAHPETHPRRLEGIVVSTAMQKTCVIVVERWKMHPKYRKAYRVRRKYKVHDPEGTAVTGDHVRVEECRPISKEKRWRFVEKIVGVS